MDGTDQSSLELGEVEVKISKFALHLSTPSDLIIQNSMKTVRIKPGEEFSLICETYGRPTPNILWYKNNLQIKRQWFHYSHVNYGIRIINSGTSELKYQFVTTNDSGNYTCHAQNIYGHVQKSINIEVQYMTSTDSIITSTQVSRMDMSNGLVRALNDRIINDKPCFSDHDCLRTTCKVNNSLSRKVSYKSCVCSDNDNLPKCLSSEITKNQILSNNDEIDLNSFKTCKDGCDPNMSRLFLLSVLSLLLFLLVVFLVMVFITKRQRARYKLTFSSTKVNRNANKKNQRCLLIDKSISLLDSSTNPSPSYSWKMINPAICSEGSKYVTIQPSTATAEKLCYLENSKQLNLNVEKSISECRHPYPDKRLFLSTATKGEVFHAKQIPNAELHQQASITINQNDNSRISSNIVMKSLI